MTQIQLLSQMKSIFLAFGFVIISSWTVFGQSIHHTLSMPEPQTHYFHVELKLSDFSDDELILALPTWAPGSYLIREFSKNINIVRAKNEKGQALDVRKITKNKWKISKGKAKEVTVNYEVYAFELTVRTSFLDLTHGYLNGSNIFMYPEGKKDLGGKLTIIPYKDFGKVATALPKVSDGVANDDRSETFTFNDYDHLADSPIEIGNHEEFYFDASGVRHKVAMYGAGNYDIPTLQRDMARIVESSTAIFGENPNKEYLFIIHNTNVGSGGLEHLESTTLNVNRWTYEGAAYLRFLSLVAHEYFHLWHVKRLRPDVLGPFDYDQENYTDLLWVMEGFTSYYDDLILRRAGFYSKDAYLSRLFSTLNYVEGSIGNKVQPVAHSSFDAWIKAYRPNENSSNTNISYYSKGHLIAAVFDAWMITKSKGKRGMDEFLTVLYKKYYKELNRGISTEEFQKELEVFLKEDLSDFFQRYIYGTETIDYAKYFKPLGLTVDKEEGQAAGFGVATKMEDNRLIVRTVSSGSQAEKAGLSPNDELIAFNGFRIGKSEFSEFMQRLTVGEEFSLIISRDEELMLINATYGTLDAVRYSYDLDESNKLGQFWLREK